MDLPASLEGESRRRLLQGAALGSIVTMVVGFYWGGWITQRSAQDMARLRAENALVTALVPICVDKFRSSANAAANTAELKGARSFMQGPFIAQGGWATTSGSDAPNTAVADACASALMSSASK